MKNPFRRSLRKNLELARLTHRVAGVRGLAAALLGTACERTFRLTLRHPLAREQFVIRCPTSDVAAFAQVFLDEEYACNVRRPPRVIVDAGANIGLASIYFATRFPEARIVAIEPEDSNLELLRLNTQPYANVTVCPGALWHRDESLSVVDRGAGKWGFVTEARDAALSGGVSGTQETRGITVPTLLKEFGIDEIDVFKVDIEGAEKELFEDCGDWIGRTHAVIAEVHEYARPGAAAAFAAATAGFAHAWQRRENEFRARDSACIFPTREARQE